MESGDGSWALDRPWGTTTPQALNGLYCLTDSPGSNYANSVDASATLKVYLQGMRRPLLTYWQLYSLELNRDFGFVEVSGDDGASWSRYAEVTGYNATNWQQQRLDLTPFGGQQVLIRFRLVSSGSVQDDGWYLDTVGIAENPAATAYPFYDSMDSVGSQTNWLTVAPWRQVGGSAQSTTGQSWQCQMGDNAYRFDGNSPYSMLTLAGGMDLTGAVAPQWSFWWRSGSQTRNTLGAQVSRDGGKNWSTVWSWNSQWSLAAAWQRVQVDLSSYAGATNLALRYYAYQNGSDNYIWDFQIDQVLIDERRSELAVSTAPGPDPEHNAVISWQAALGQNFDHYAIYRATHTNVTVNDTQVALIPSRNTLSFVDTDLAWCGQNYYYRVMVFYSDGYATAGTNEVVFRTSYGPTVTTLPFADQFESGNIYWALDRPWGTTAEQAHSGTHSLTDSPGAEYANSFEGAATLKVDLRTATRPCLTYWQQYSLENGRDFGFVEVSVNDGATWLPWAVVSGYADWQVQRLDLSPYAGTIALLRFRLKTDGQNPEDGWYLDDVGIRENPSAAPYPFYDNMNSMTSQSNWLAATWSQSGGSAQDQPGLSWRCLMGDGLLYGSNLYSGGLNSSLTLAGTLDLSRAVQPKLWFWWRSGQQWYHTLAAQVSADGGKNWDTVWIWNSLDAGPSPWQPVQVSLPSYVGRSQVSLRFLANNPVNTPVLLDFQVDEVLVAEQYVPAILTSSPLPDTVVGVAYNQALLATNGTPPYAWTVISNALPPGLSLANNGVLSGNPTTAGTTTFQVRVADSLGHAQPKEYSLRVLQLPPPLASQSSQPFVSPGTNVVFCQVNNPTTHRLLSLVWTPWLPAGWSILNVSGDGDPARGPDGAILFRAEALTNQSLQFSYVVAIPAGQRQGGVVGGLVTYLYDGMGAEATISASPELLQVSPRLYHSADCNHDWSIETTEASRVLGYWRAGAYRLDAFSCDGYAPGQGDRVGPLHAADFQPPYWQIDGTEANRVLAYWRAGCYQRNTNSPDGFVAGCAAAGMMGRIAAQMPSTYTPGASFLITNTAEYSGALLSLLWRPILPPGWTVSSVFGDGHPELVNGEIVWTDMSLPSSPLTMIYTVQVPLGETGAQQVRNQVEYFVQGMITPAQRYADPDPVTLTTAVTPFCKLTAIVPLPEGPVELDFIGTNLGPFRIQFTPNLGPSATWNTLIQMPGLNGAGHYFDTDAANAPGRFYRLIAP